MKTYKVKHRVTGIVTVMNEEVFNKISLNKNLFVPSKESTAEEPVLETPFEIVEECDHMGHNKAEAKAHLAKHPHTVHSKKPHLKARKPGKRK